MSLGSILYVPRRRWISERLGLKAKNGRLRPGRMSLRGLHHARHLHDPQTNVLQLSRTLCPVSRIKTNPISISCLQSYFITIFQIYSHVMNTIIGYDLRRQLNFIFFNLITFRWGIFYHY